MQHHTNEAKSKREITCYDVFKDSTDVKILLKK